MIELSLLGAVFIGIAVLLVLILFFRIPAFIALLISSITVGFAAGMDPIAAMESVTIGMGGTLGLVATLVGLGAMFGAILEHSGGAQAIANYMTSKLGENRSPLAMMISGFVIAIPVFFDVAFIILVPVVYALQRKTGRSLLAFAIPLLAGLAVTHAFIPPTPGPIAVAEIIEVDLGWVILAGFIAGIPTAIIAGLIFGRYIEKKIHLTAPESDDTEPAEIKFPDARLIMSIIALPILLILANTLVSTEIIQLGDSGLGHFFNTTLAWVGHPFSALIIANLAAWYALGIRRGVSKETLFKITSRSMAPAGTIILLTGAGGAFKQMLVDTGAGEMIAQAMESAGFPIIVFGFLAAMAVRLLQGSATVSMITAAGLVSPLLVTGSFSGLELASIVVAIAAGASTLSHVNDSGFWLVSQYLGMSEKQTFLSWSMMTTLVALSGFLMAVVIYLLA
ncbi:MAG: gluconate:H+ symporter [Bacteroidota bacterium]